MIIAFLVSTIIGIIATFFFELVLKSNRKLRQRYYVHHEILFGYHVHHSTVGLLFMILSVVLFLLRHPASAVAMVGIGLGIIVMHTISSGRFVFIEKEAPAGDIK